MRISLASHGGWTAGLRRPPLTVDTDRLPAPAAAQVEQLAAAAENAAAGPVIESAPAPDRRAPEAMRYTITIERDGKEIRLSGSDLDDSPEFALLREWIEAQARP